ncbi:MAG: hypothetical protein JWQ49_1248 [Edaphobacter sp.]|nr:hypothetical protein [Edaphobacter sp.]
MIFVLKSWQASDTTVHWLERQGYVVQVVPLAFEPDEDFLDEVLGLGK